MIIPYLEAVIPENEHMAILIPDSDQDNNASLQEYKGSFIALFLGNDVTISIVLQKHQYPTVHANFRYNQIFGKLFKNAKEWIKLVLEFIIIVYMLFSRI